MQKYREAIARDADNAVARRRARHLGRQRRRAARLFPKRPRRSRSEHWPGCCSRPASSYRMRCCRRIPTPRSAEEPISPCVVARMRRRPMASSPMTDAATTDFAEGDFSSVEALAAHLVAIDRADGALSHVDRGRRVERQPVDLRWRSHARSVDRGARSSSISARPRIGSPTPFIAMRRTTAGRAAWLNCWRARLPSPRSCAAICLPVSTSLPPAPARSRATGSMKFWTRSPHPIEFVLIHASDWRSDLALAAMDHVHKAIVVSAGRRGCAMRSFMRERPWAGRQATSSASSPANDRAQVDRAA